MSNFKVNYDQLQRFQKNIVYIRKGGEGYMFELEIRNKCIVELYDNRQQLIKIGTITGYKHKQNYIVIDDCVLYPANHIAKIKVHNNDTVTINRLAQQ